MCVYITDDDDDDLYPRPYDVVVVVDYLLMFTLHHH